MISFRRLARGDFPLLSQWLAADHVNPWWREPHDLKSIEERYGPSLDGEDPTEVFVVENDGEAIGMIQRYLHRDDPEWRRVVAGTGVPSDAAGIDYLIGEKSAIGEGLGTEMIERFVGETFDRYRDTSAIAVDVLQANRRSWRALEKAGFERIWSGRLDSDDPSDDGPAYVYVRARPEAGN